MSVIVKIPTASPARQRLERAIGRLPADPATCFYRHASRLARVLTISFDRALAPSGLTASQFTVLMTLARVGPSPVGTLAHALAVDDTSVPRLLAPLQRRRLIASARGDDRRVRVLAVTDRGLDLLRATLPLWARQQAAIAAEFGGDAWEQMRPRLSSLQRVARTDVAPAEGQRGRRAA